MLPKAPCPFGISLQNMVNPTPRPVQDESWRGKPYYTLFFRRVWRWSYVERLSSETRRVLLSAEPIMKIDPPVFLTKEWENCFFVEVTIAREVIWKSRFKGVIIRKFMYGSGMVYYFIIHLKRKVGLERRYLSGKIFKARWLRVTRVLSA